MSLLPITLGVKRNSDAKGGSPKKKPLKKSQLADLLQDALKKDDFTCRYCAFHSKEYQKAIPKDWAVNDPRDAELVTACIFCEQCMAIETVAPMASGTLIWLPEISQMRLNHLARTIYVSRFHSANAPQEVNDCANRAFEVLLNRRGEAKRRIGTDDPAVLASALIENLDDATYRKRGPKLEGVRLMPLDRRVLPGPTGEVDQFPKIIEYWAGEQGSYHKWPVDKWADILSLVQGASAAA